MKKLLLALVLCFWVGTLPAQAQSGPKLPAGFAMRKLADRADGLERPTAFAFLPTGQILIAEKRGLLKLWENGVVYGQPVLDLRDEVNEFVDRGLVGLAVDPEFAHNYFIYVLYTYDAPGQQRDVEAPRHGRLVRYELQPTAATGGWVAKRNSAKVLLNDFRSDSQNHSVGSVRVARDNTLFVSLGDGAMSAAPSDLSLRAQDVDALEGKLLRINRDGSGYAGNPFYDAQRPRSARSRVWAYGFRMPFRFGVQPQTHLPFVGHVGWFKFESLARATAGANFGWPCIEGAQPVPEFKDAAVCKALKPSQITPHEVIYEHAGNNASITGGDFAQGQIFPAEMLGNFFYGDYSTQVLKRAVLNERGEVLRVETFAEGVGEPVDIQFGPDGALYVLSIYSKGLVRISFTANEAQSPKTTTQPLKYAKPTAQIVAPGHGSVVLPGTVLRLIGTASVDKPLWQATLHETDGARAQTLLRAVGATATLTMPVLSAQGFVEIIFSAMDVKGNVGAQRVRLYSPPADGYMRAWWLVGGFPYRTLGDGAIDEAAYDNPSTDRRAQLVRSASYRVDLAEFISPADHTVAYAFAYIFVPTPRKGLLGMNSDDGVAVWLNGQAIWRNNVSRYVPKPGEPDDLRDMDLPPIELQAGLNKLLVKVDQNIGDWAFKVRVLNADGSVMRDAVAVTAPLAK